MERPSNTNNTAGRNVNVSASSDFTVLVKYLLYLVLLLVGVCVLLDGVVHVASSFMSYRQIDRLMQPISGRAPSAPFGVYAPKLQKLEALKNRFFLEDGFSGQEFSIGLQQSTQINAFLTPHKQIFFTTTLLNNIQDEDTLFFVLAHEIGHYKNKDLFRSVMRQLLFQLAASLFEQQVANGTSQSMVLHYSRSSEFAADCFAARKLQKVYGSTEGGRKFFEYLAKNEPRPEWAQYLASHPGYAKRIDNLSRCQAE